MRKISNTIVIYIVQESPMCDLIPMKNNDKALTWSCNDFTEEGGKLEKLAARA